MTLEEGSWSCLLPTWSLRWDFKGVTRILAFAYKKACECMEDDVLSEAILFSPPSPFHRFLRKIMLGSQSGMTGSE